MFLMFLCERVQHRRPSLSLSLSCFLFSFFSRSLLMRSWLETDGLWSQRPSFNLCTSMRYYFSSEVMLALNLRIDGPMTPTMVGIASSPNLQASSSMCCTRPLMVLNSRSLTSLLMPLPEVMVGQWKIFWEWTAESMCWRRSFLVVKVREHLAHGQVLEVES